MQPGAPLQPYLPPEAAQAIAAASLSVPGVSSLFGGITGEIALLYPRLRVPGLVVVANLLEVQVVVEVDLAHPRHIPTVIKQVYSEVEQVMAEQAQDCGITAIRVIAADAVAAK